jgi:hypothetical protein
VIVNKRPLSTALAYHGHAVAPGSGFKLSAAYFISTHIMAPLAAAWRFTLEWRRRWHSRQALRLLSVREIRDFCPDLMKAECESRKPFWRA